MSRGFLSMNIIEVAVDSFHGIKDVIYRPIDNILCNPTYIINMKVCEDSVINKHSS